MSKHPFDKPGPFLKLCGMFREADIDAVNAAVPDFCGFIINFPKSHRNVTPERAEELAVRLDAQITPVGVFVDEPLQTIISLVRRGVVTTVQLHGSESATYIQALREQAKPSAIIQAFKVQSAEDVARACESSADMILLDSGKGSGESFDWSLVQTATRPFMLAGGLRSENIARAIEQTQPWALDMSSGLETDKMKDATKIMRAAEIVKELR